MYVSLWNQPGNLFGQFESLRRELDEAFGYSGIPSSIRSVASGSYPAINVGRTPESVEVYAFAPGLDATKLDITLDRGLLRISGERQAVAAQKEGAEKEAPMHTYLRERSGGKFTRAVSLPDDIDPTQVNATYRDGVLQISIARRESAQPKRIAVQ